MQKREVEPSAKNPDFDTKDGVRPRAIDVAMISSQIKIETRSAPLHSGAGKGSRVRQPCLSMKSKTSNCDSET